MSRMLIAYVSDYLPGYHSRAGGADWAAFRVGRLMEAGADIKVDYFVRGPDKKGIDKGARVYRVPVIEDLLPAFISKYLELAKWCILQLDPLAFAYFLLRFMAHRPAVVHMHRFRALTMAPIAAARFLRIPVFFSVYDYWMFCTLETLIDEKNAVCRRFHGIWCHRCLPNRFSWLQKPLLVFRKGLFNWALNRIAKFVVLSRSSSEILKAYGIPEHKITIIPLPYGKDFAKTGIKEVPEKDTLVYTGWIQKRKGLDVLLAAMALVAREVPGVKLNIIGPDVVWEKEYRARIDGLIKGLGLAGNINWLGPQPNESVQGFIRLSEVVVVPEQWENMSPVIVGEAMLNGRAVVGSRLGGIPDFVLDEKTGLLFDAASSEDLARKLVYLLKNKATAARMGEEGFKFASELFSDASIRAKYNRVYGIS